MRVIGFLLLLVCAVNYAIAALPDIQVQGLMEGRAVLTIEGNMHVLKEGDSSPEGVEVVEATSDFVIIEFEGASHELGLSARAGGTYEVPSPDAVIIPAGDNGHYFVQGLINGHPATMLVDTGASFIALNSAHAKAMNIDYKSGQPGMVTTASGVAEMYQITLNSVTIGQISLSQINAAVIEGGFPEEILLGNSFLSRVNMRQDGQTMVLESKF